MAAMRAEKLRTCEMRGLHYSLHTNRTFVLHESRIVLVPCQRVIVGEWQGVVMQQEVCSKCGVPRESGRRFCDSCGQQYPIQPTQSAKPVLPTVLACIGILVALVVAMWVLTRSGVIQPSAPA